MKAGNFSSFTILDLFRHEVFEDVILNLSCDIVLELGAHSEHGVTSEPGGLLKLEVKVDENPRCKLGHNLTITYILTVSGFKVVEGVND